MWTRESARLLHVPIQALAHMLIAPIALILGPFQFSPGLRAKYPQAHRWSGRVYVTACAAAGIAALAASPYASGGPVAELGFGILAVLWVSTTLGAWRAAVRRRFALHRLLMRFSYGMTFGAVTLRLQIPLGFALGYPSYSAMSVWLAYTSWISERDRGGALFDDEGSAPSNAIRHGLIFSALLGVPPSPC